MAYIDAFWVRETDLALYFGIIGIFKVRFKNKILKM
jgi:hypothetical protein